MSRSAIKHIRGRHSRHHWFQTWFQTHFRRVPTPVLILVLVAGMLFLFAAITAKAHAGYCAHWYRVRVSDGWNYHLESRCARWVRDDYGPRVYSYERRWDDDEDRRSGRLCRDTRRAVGDQHLTQDGAKKAANDAWAAAVRFHLGEKYMSLDNARHLVYTCSRSSIKEGGATTLGQTLTRCELQAQPCAPLPQFETREGEPQ